MSTFAGSTGNAPMPRGGEQADANSGRKGFPGNLKALWARMNQNDCAGLAAEMAYNWMLALLPILIFMFAVFGMMHTETDLFAQTMDNMRRLVPPDAFNLIQGSLSELTKDSSQGLAIASLMGALWTSSNGAVTIEKGINRAYRCIDKKRGFIQQRLVALAIVVGMALILLVFSNLLVFGDAIIAGIEHYLNPGDGIIAMLGVLRWTIPIAGLLAVSMFIYAIAPDYHEKGAWKKSWPGALTFVVLWIGISVLFSTYVSNMGNYNKVYGPMGAIVILMIWLYLTSYALLIGGEVNAMVNGCDEGSLNAPPEPHTS